jgi:hypothetical protein
MKTVLNQQGTIPLNQPYAGVPWTYDGDETVMSIPNPDVVDWVLVELRETPGEASTATIDKRIDRQAGFLLKNGMIVGIDGSSNLTFNVTINDNLYLIIWHRNHLSVMSAIPLSQTDDIYNYDFTTDALKAFGGNSGHKEIVPGIWAMFGGNGNGDAIINEKDIEDVWNSHAGRSGYLPADYSMDNQINNTDKNEIWYPNYSSISQVPE